MVPTWAIILDYILGMIMWTLIGRAAMNIFSKRRLTFFRGEFLLNIPTQLLNYLSPLLQVSCSEDLLRFMLLGFFIYLDFMQCPTFLAMMFWACYRFH